MEHDYQAPCPRKRLELTPLQWTFGAIFFFISYCIVKYTDHKQKEKKRLQPSDSPSYYVALNPDITRHFTNPVNQGSLDAKDSHVGTGAVRAPYCKDVMKLQIKGDGDGKIIDAKFKSVGCRAAIASSSLATELVMGKSVDDAMKIKNTDIAKDLSLQPAELHCAILAEGAIREAVIDYKAKEAQRSNKGSPTWKKKKQVK